MRSLISLLGMLLISLSTACSHIHTAPPAEGGYAEWSWPTDWHADPELDNHVDSDLIPRPYREAKLRLDHYKVTCAIHYFPGLIADAETQWNRTFRAWRGGLKGDAHSDLINLNLRLDEIDRRIVVAGRDRSDDLHCSFPVITDNSNLSDDDFVPLCRTPYEFTFDLDIDTPTGVQHRAISDLAHKLKKIPYMRAYIYGHADLQGDVKYNDALAYRRAFNTSQLLREDVNNIDIKLGSAGERQAKQAETSTIETRRTDRKVSVDIYVPPASKATYQDICR